MQELTDSILRILQNQISFKTNIHENKSSYLSFTRKMVHQEYITMKISFTIIMK